MRAFLAIKTTKFKNVEISGKKFAIEISGKMQNYINSFEKRSEILIGKRVTLFGFCEHEKTMCGQNYNQIRDQHDFLLK